MEPAPRKLKITYDEALARGTNLLLKADIAYPGYLVGSVAQADTGVVQLANAYIALARELRESTYYKAPTAGVGEAGE